MHEDGKAVLAGAEGVGALASGQGLAQQRECNDALETRSDELDGNLRSGLDEVRATVGGEVKALGEKHSKARRQVERRLVRLEAGTGAQDGTVIVEWRKACVEYKGRGEHRDCVDQDHRQEARVGAGDRHHR